MFEMFYQIFSLDLFTAMGHTVSEESRNKKSWDSNAITPGKKSTIADESETCLYFNRHAIHGSSRR